MALAQYPAPGLELTRLYPDPARVEVAAVAAALRDVAAASAARPYLALNFASTADGRITIGGRSGPIGNEADRELFHELRGQADAVMVGASTVRGEGYRRLIREPERRERRRAAGLDPDPLAVIVSARLRLDPSIPLLQDEQSHVVIVTASPMELEGVRARVDYLRPPEAPDEELPDGGPMLELAPLMPLLRERHGVELVLCEGGSVLAHTLAREGLVDELLLSLAPKLAAGDGPAVTTGPAFEPPLAMTLASAHEAGGHLFLRYRVAGS
jgi:riboflavin-specific deaminase-like protein